MVVTERPQRKGFKTYLLMSLMAAAFWITGCAVDDSSTTVGAFTCNPSTNSQNSYTASVAPTLVSCAACHRYNGATPKGSRFHITGTDALDICTIYAFGALVPSKPLLTYPNNPKHTGFPTTFNAVDAATIQAWLNAGMNQ